MKRSPLTHKVIRSVGYDPETRVLELEFPQERVYQYFDVPPGTYTWLLRTEDLLGFFERMIRDVYRYEEVTTVGPAGPREEIDLEDLLLASLEGGEE